MTTKAELHVPIATVRLVQFDMPEPVAVDDIVLDRDEDAYRIDLCLTPRPHNSRARYSDRWGPDRFEQIGNVFVVPPGEAVQVRSDGCLRQDSLTCQLRTAPTDTWFESKLPWAARRLEASLDVPAANIRNLLLRLVEELLHPGFATHVLVEALAVQLTIDLARYCEAIDERPVTHGLAPWRLRLIDERLREVREAPSLVELADLCRLSARQLTRGFRASRGCSVGDHVALARVEHAKRLLATDQPVKTIARTLGFSSSSAFAVAFRRATGEVPHQYRQHALRDG